MIQQRKWRYWRRFTKRSLWLTYMALRAGLTNEAHIERAESWLKTRGSTGPTPDDQAELYGVWIEWNDAAAARDAGHWCVNGQTGVVFVSTVYRLAAQQAIAVGDATVKIVGPDGNPLPVQDGAGEMETTPTPDDRGGLLTALRQIRDNAAISVSDERIPFAIRGLFADIVTCAVNAISVVPPDADDAKAIAALKPRKYILKTIEQENEDAHNVLDNHGISKYPDGHYPGHPRLSLSARIELLIANRREAS
jgi:hypothetical protein